MSISWYSKLNPIERSTFWASFAGYTMDSFDSTMYALVAPVLITIVGFTKPEIGALTTAGLIGNCLGGWIAGIIADRLGRMTLLKATILWVAAFSGLAAAAMNYQEFFAVRFLQGLGFGGEAAVAGVLISETVRPALRGRVVPATQAGYGFGYALSTMLMPVLFALFPQAVGWRVMFVLGVIPALLVLYIRRNVPESTTFLASLNARRAGARVVPFWSIFNRLNRRSTLVGLLLATGVLGGGFGIHAWLPTYLRLSLHLKVASTAAYLACSIAGLLIGPVIAGLVRDRVGRRAVIVCLLACDASVVACLLYLHFGLLGVLSLIFLQGTLQGGAAACLLPTFAELFPTEIRASGVGFCITGGRGFGSICTSVVGLLSTTMPLGHAMGVCSLNAFGLAAVAALFLPRQNGDDLDDVGTAAHGLEMAEPVF